MKMFNKLVNCGCCHGDGKYIVEYIDWWPRYEYCGYCNGTGKTTKVMNMWITIWKNYPNYNPSKKSEIKHKKILNENGFL